MNDDTMKHALNNSLRYVPVTAGTHNIEQLAFGGDQLTEQLGHERESKCEQIYKIHQQPCKDWFPLLLTGMQKLIS